jgi:hypothetical protein
MTHPNEQLLKDWFGVAVPLVEREPVDGFGELADGVEDERGLAVAGGAAGDAEATGRDFREAGDQPLPRDDAAGPVRHRSLAAEESARSRRHGVCARLTAGNTPILRQCR